MSGESAPMGQILADIETALNITWDDEATHARIRRLIEDGMAYLNDKRGEPGDFTTPGYPRTLLTEYVRYARDEALDVFENNYQSLILAMQNERQVQAYADSLESAAET